MRPRLGRRSAGSIAISHSRRFVKDDLVLRMLRQPDSHTIEALNDEFSDIMVSGRIEAILATDTERVR